MMSLRLLSPYGMPLFSLRNKSFNGVAYFRSAGVRYALICAVCALSAEHAPTRLACF